MRDTSHKGPLDHVKGPLTAGASDLVGFMHVRYRGRVVATVTNLGNQARANAQLFKLAPDAVALLRLAAAGENITDVAGYLLDRLDAEGSP